MQKEQAGKRAELDAVSGGKWVYPHGDAATRVRDAVNAELKSRGMQPDAKIFCELLNMEDESWQDCVEACLGDRRFDILVPPAHYEAAKSAFVALKDKVGPISLLDTPGIRKANRRADKYGPDSLAAQVSSENPLAAQYAQTILGRIVCCDTPDTLEQHPDSATRDLLRHHPFRLERLRTPQRYIGLDARRARAGALAAELEALGESARAAAQTEQNLKAAYNQYQTLLRGTALEELAALWDARAALTAAQNAVTEQEAKLTECRENPLLQQLYKEEEAREAAWETARAAVEQTGGDIRVCQKQIASCEAEQKKAGETAQQSADEIVGSPELPGKLIRGPSGVDVTAVDLHRVSVQHPDAGPQLLQNGEQQRHVADLGDVFNAADAVHQNGGGNNGNGGVLRTADLHLAEQRLASVYDVFCQRSDLVSGILLRGESLAPGLVCPSGWHFMHPEKKVDSTTHYDRRQYSILCLKKQTIPDKI